MNKKTILVVSICIAVLLIAATVYYFKSVRIESDYYTPVVVATHFNGEHYVGSITCIECHADIYKNHINTAHYGTSAVANSENIKGSFNEGANILDLETVSFEMKREGDSFFQHTNIKNRTVHIPAAKLDVVIGSGVRGQTYLNWEEDKLFQLQVSYHKPTNSWINSPGYPNYYLERPVRGACLKCHVTFAENKDFSGQGNLYNKKKIIYGVNCERCHRPSEKHVSYHKNNPDVKTPKFIMTMDTISRQQRLDVCAQCHSGSRSMVIKGNSFSFLSGEILDEYLQNPHTGNEERPDVHGNQYGLLTNSECFKNTATMDCTTCHNPHKNQRNDTTYFNSKCIGCHNSSTVACKRDNHNITGASDCISCHMPIMPSQSMKAQLTADSLETSFYIRTHLIGIYIDKLSDIK